MPANTVAFDFCTNVVMFLGGIGITCLWYKFLDAFSLEDVRRRWKKWCVPYEVNQSNRILGVTEDRIVDGRWTLAVVSLWRCKYFEYFIVEVDELAEKRVTAITKSKAREFIEQYAEPALASRLLRDWLDILPEKKEQSCLGCE